MKIFHLTVKKGTEDGETSAESLKSNQNCDGGKDGTATMKKYSRGTKASAPIPTKILVIGNRFKSENTRRLRTTKNL